ncbi:SoxR reducing system RseC family protein [Alkalimarinus alittae]|uniref:SoxR reducing system RseC family protein n=1 Tax=Alkalimarinus alittae TaxID=2961619 RepID=A0ABY6MZF6_9ALTE|nr:SoxR reducing system RseC family protein [Alkalimarinus alittae]UZE95232.1 SoxR reducing system RseC family protein [Alkalimarinus alittae]
MLEETGVVVAVEKGQAWVQTIRKSACSSCEAKSGCGQGVLARISDGKANQVLVSNTLNLKVGEDVLIGIPEDLLVKASVMVYLLPLLMMIAAASIAEKWLLIGDAWVALAGVSGLAFGFVLVKLYSNVHKNDQRFCPKMIKAKGFQSIHSVEITT